MLQVSRIVVSVVIALASASSLLAQPSQELAEQLLPLITSHAGTVSVAVKHLPSGAEFYHEADRPLPTASLIKLPVMIEAYRQAAEGEVNLDQRIDLKDEDKVPGSGILTTNFTDVTLSLRDAIRLMIAYSDNTATNLVVDQIGLPATAESMALLGCPNTKLHAKVYRRDTSIFPDRSEQFGLGSTTAREMVSLLERLEGGHLVSIDACEAMKTHLLACEDRSKLPRLLPAGTKVAHKTGSVSATRTDAGIIYGASGPILICVLTNDNQDQSWTESNAAEILCGEIGQRVFRFFNPPTAADPAAARELQVGSLGELVEALQRTLNARLDPSPKLSTDGDFGPATESAVKAFQRQSNLPDTGVVNSATWERLGPLVEMQPVPEPSVVNSELLPTQSADPLVGPPWTSSVSWIIVDGKSGKQLAGHLQDEPKDPASTTKIVTALVVLEMATENAALLDEIVTFSERADKTIGSTSGLRAGEQVPVRELLYGLLLPSGNDASVALAEHCGAKLVEPQSTGQAGYDAFIARMNATAKRIGMTSTTLANPHGLTDAAHKMSANDLAKVSLQALQLPLFRQIVATRQYGCTVTSKSGYTRNVKWENTNQLLGTEGYSGVKTGTTDAAGACLVSFAERDGSSRVCVILGAGNSRARYADTRNLLRWSWTLEAP